MRIFSLGVVVVVVAVGLSGCQEAPPIRIAPRPWLDAFGPSSITRDGVSLSVTALGPRPETTLRVGPYAEPAALLPPATLLLRLANRGDHPVDLGALDVRTLDTCGCVHPPLTDERRLADWIERNLLGKGRHLTSDDYGAIAWFVDGLPLPRPGTRVQPGRAWVGVVPLAGEIFDDEELAVWLSRIHAARVEVRGLRVEAPGAARPLDAFTFDFTPAPIDTAALCDRLSRGG